MGVDGVSHPRGSGTLIPWWRKSAGGRGWEVNVMRGLWAGFQIWVEGCVNQIWEIIMDDFASGTMAVLSQRCSRRYSFFRSL